MKIADFNLDTDGTFIIAEMSANHGGDIEIAKATIRAASEVGANAVKLQTYTADTMTLDCDSDDFRIKGGTLWDNRKLYDLYREAHLPWEWHAELFELAREIGVEIFSTPFDRSSVDFLDQFTPSAYKIASFEITDHALIAYTASKGKPILISTGIATYEEIQAAVNICRNQGNEDIVLLQCTSSYPTPLSDANLLTIPDLAQTFNVATGYSDHTLGTVAPVVAVSLGARVVEKHFILDRATGGSDAAFSLDKQQFQEMVESVRNAERLLGQVDYSLTDKKQASRQFSRSLYVVEDVQAGTPISEKNVRAIRPGFGMHPKHLKDIVGQVFLKDHKRGDRLVAENIGEMTK